jgi:hypothetical protein
VARFSKKLASLTKVANSRGWVTATLAVWVDADQVVSDPQMQEIMKGDPASREKLVEARLREMMDEKLREVVGSQGDTVQLRSSEMQLDERYGAAEALAALEKHDADNRDSETDEPI